MAAISTSIMANVKSGDHVIFQEDLYGGTRNFIKTEFDKYGIEYSFTKGLESEDFTNEIRDNTVGIFGINHSFGVFYFNAELDSDNREIYQIGFNLKF